MNPKKSQAALEFLTTYGWAILVILIMVGTLAYFGILAPSKALPNRCTFGTEFQCLDYQIAAGATPTTGTFKLKLKNGAGEAVSISAIALGSETSTQYSCTLTSPTLPFTFNASGVSDFSFGTCNSVAAGFVAGEKGKVLVTVTYNTLLSGSAYSRQAKGEVYTGIV